MNSFCVIPILVQKILALKYITLHLPSFISQVPANTITEANKPSLSPEEMKIKAQELRCVHELIAFLLSLMSRWFYIYLQKIALTCVCL